MLLEAFNGLALIVEILGLVLLEGVLAEALLLDRVHEVDDLLSDCLLFEQLIGSRRLAHITLLGAEVVLDADAAEVPGLDWPGFLLHVLFLVALLGHCGHLPVHL
mmetsp:Transcript_44941/g.43517  ORF Transcript_44941/g.43517 Transcript_44941/m.43517 type:complete len:105 (+) Transcript_44941:1268-1582(+)